MPPSGPKTHRFRHPIVIDAPTLAPAAPARLGRDIAKPFPFDLVSTSSRFEIHREEEVSITSTLFCGGDWQWQLCSLEGNVLAEAGGYRSERACRAAISAIKEEAGSASVQLRA
jgi:uncharacterized protein YegP (UPF0339 family)